MKSEVEQNQNKDFNESDMNNFFFFRPEVASIHPELGIMFFHRDSTFFKWKRLQKFLFENYDIPTSYNGKFSFTAYGSPIYGVVDNTLLLIPFKDDTRLKPELLSYFEDIWDRMNNSKHDKPIKGYNIDELYNIFNLEDYKKEEYNYKKNGNVITYKNDHTFYKNF